MAPRASSAAQTPRARRSHRAASPSPGDKDRRGAAREGGGPGTVYLGRQPILDAALQVAGYELLHRAGMVAAAAITDGDKASQEVAARTLLDFGLDRLVGGHPAYLNSTLNFITSGSYRLLPAAQVVLEVLEDTEVTDELRASLRQALAEGYRFALDDYAGPCPQDELAPLAAVVKVDLRAVAPGDLTRLTERLRTLTPGAALLAEKVETAEELERCRALGFELYQGFYFSRPTTLTQREVPISALSMLELTASLQRPDLRLREMESIIDREPVLAYRLLRLVNAGSVSLPKRVTSIHQALVLLGIENVRRLATLLSLSALGAGAEHLVEESAIRARMCQKLASEEDPSLAEAAFTTGLLSMLDVLIGVPLEELIARMPLTPAIQAAIVEGSGPLGRILDRVVSYGGGDLEQMAADGADLPAALDAFHSAVDWLADLRPGLHPV